MRENGSKLRNPMLPLVCSLHFEGASREAKRRQQLKGGRSRGKEATGSRRPVLLFNVFYCGPKSVTQWVRGIRVRFSRYIVSGSSQTFRNRGLWHLRLVKHLNTTELNALKRLSLTGQTQRFLSCVCYAIG